MRFLFSPFSRSTTMFCASSNDTIWLVTMNACSSFVAASRRPRTSSAFRFSSRIPSSDTPIRRRRFSAR